MSEKNESKLGSILYVSFIGMVFVLLILFTERLITEPSHDLEDTTIFYPLTLIFLIVLFFVASFYLFGLKAESRTIKTKVRLIMYFTLVIIVGGLSWSLRGVWGHQTGTLVWGTLIFSVLMLENDRDNHIFVLFFANIGLALGAMLPFSNYPFFLRLIHFAFWGLLGTFFGALGRYFFFRNKFESNEPFRSFHMKASGAGFVGLGIGITLASALYIDEGWFPGWAGGYVTGSIYAIVVAVFLYRNDKKYSDEIEIPDFLILFEQFQHPKSTSQKFIKIIIYIILFGYVPIAGILNIGDYFYFELGIAGYPFWLILILCLIYFGFTSFLIIKYSEKLGGLKHRDLELLILFLITLWPSSLSAILRYDTGGIPDIIYSLNVYEFSMTVLISTIFCSILMIFYYLIENMNKKEINRKEKIKKKLKN